MIKGLGFDMKGFFADLSADSLIVLLRRLEEIIFESREHILSKYKNRNWEIDLEKK